MSRRKRESTSKRKRSTPQKLKREPFLVAANDLFESDEEDEQPFLSQLPEMLHNQANTKRRLLQTPSKKESLPQTPQNKENRPEKYSRNPGSASRGRGRPKGSKNKTFPVSSARVYLNREGKSPVVYTPKNNDLKNENGVETPSRGRGRPKGSTKVKPVPEDVPKKSRGRPKGSKNRKPAKASLKKLTPGSRTSGRGRPRKLPILTNEEDTPKRERGRPKGSLNKRSLKKVKPIGEDVPKKSTTLTPGSAKVQRGRPRKLPIFTIEDDSPKRERGRPKGTLNKNSRKRIAIAQALSQGKGSRGRPKKIVLDSSTLMPLSTKRPRGRPKSIGGILPVPSDMQQHSDDDTENFTDEGDSDA